MPTTSTPSPRKTPVYLRPAQYVVVAIREFIKESGLARSSALAYTTLLALIPLAVVVLSVMGMIQDERLDVDAFVNSAADTMLWPEELTYLIVEEPEVVERLEGPALPEVDSIVTEEELVALRQVYGEQAFKVRLQDTRKQQIVSTLTEYTDNLRTNLNLIGIVGAIFLLVSTISLFNSIEHNLNALWHLKSKRNPIRKFLVLWALLTLGPIMLAASLVLHASLPETIESGLDFFILPYLFTCGAFFFLYKFVPNTRVSTVGAIVAALIAGGLWELEKILFSHYVGEVFSSGSKLTITYGSLALIPVFLLWLYVSWVVALLGVKLCYTWQYLWLYSGQGWTELSQSTEAEELLAARVVAAIVESQYQTQRGLTLNELTSLLSLPQHRLDEVTGRLLEAQILLEDAEARRMSVAMPPDMLTVEHVTDAIRGHADTSALAGMDPTSKAIGELLSRVDQHRADVLGKSTFADLYNSRSG